MIAVDRRRGAVHEDLQRNKDCKKLADLGSTVDPIFSPSVCPTCQQAVSDSLMAPETATEVMTIDQNIAFLEKQKALLDHVRVRSIDAVASGERLLIALTRQVEEIQSEVRSLRDTLVAPTNSPALADVRERVVLEETLRRYAATAEEFDAVVAALRESVLLCEDASRRVHELPVAGLSDEDERRVSRCSALLSEQLAQFGFTTFSPADVRLHESSFRPTRDGFEIGFEVSASDGIRLKWAYHLMLLELAREFADCNHVGWVAFDEPKQQETARDSFKQLFARAAAARDAGQQVLLATSEDGRSLASAIRGLQVNLVSVDGLLMKKLE
jgi:hypothetical protein